MSSVAAQLWSYFIYKAAFAGRKGEERECNNNKEVRYIYLLLSIWQVYYAAL